MAFVSRRRRGWPPRWVAAMLVIMGVCPLSWALWVRQISAEVSLEYKVKAAFLYNFAKFVQWPQTGNTPRTGPIRLCVVGANPFGALLESLNGRTVKGRKLKIQVTSRPQDALAAQILFIALPDEAERREVLRRVRHHPVLTVSDTEGFCAQGGIINFVIVDNKVRFQVNLAAAARAGLRISSQLLKLATIVPESVP